METALRRLYGAHLTPSQIVRQYILPHVRGRLWKHLWVDLFCGEGSLIFPLVEAIEPSKRTEFFANHVLMFDVQRAQVERVVQRALDLGVSRDVATKRVVVRDTLKDYPSEIRREQSVFHVTNPPYLYLGYIVKKARQHLQYFDGRGDGYQDLYQIAMANDMQAGLQNLIYIVPTNFLFGDAVSNTIRKRLLFHYAVEKVYLFETKIFQHTGTNVGVFFFRRKPAPSDKIQQFPALKVLPTGTQERHYTICSKFRYRGGSEFEGFVEKHRRSYAPQVEFYLMMKDLVLYPGPYRLRLLDANSFESGKYSILEIGVQKDLYAHVKQNILLVRTVDTGGKERAGLYETKKVFGVDGIVVTRSTFRTHPIQLFFDPPLSAKEQLRLANYFNDTLEELRRKTDSEFMTTFRYSSSSYTRKYLGLKQVKALISTYGAEKEEEEKKYDAQKELALLGNFPIKTPEPSQDPYYLHGMGSLVLEDKSMMDKVRKIRELVATYNTLRQRKLEVPGKIVEELLELVLSEGGNISEFSAFLKVKDLSITAARKLSRADLLDLFHGALEDYVRFRERPYRERRLNYSDITPQALRDAGSSRGTGGLANRRISSILRSAGIHSVKNEPSVKDVRLLTGATFLFAEKHQGKYPDVLFKHSGIWFVVEAKHLKESGGAQDKSAVELIDFINQEDKGIYYISFLDGIYFNGLTNPRLGKKYDAVRKDVEGVLSRRPFSFFVNTAGFKELTEDIVGSN